MLRSRRLPALSAALTAALALTACGGEEPAGPAPTGSPPAAPSPPPSTTGPGLAAYYTQEVAWEPCEESTECAAVEVPLDYAEPEGDRVEIAVRRAATDAADRTGSLLVNPGGPGASGTELVSSVPQLVSQEVLEAYDVVGFDPRGVHRSTAVDCVDDAELDEIRATDYALDSPAGLEVYTEETAALAAKCAARSGELLAHVDTVSAAKDLDIVRAALGDERLHYLGYSYGTLLGATYADLFPERVGRLVLDGGMEPSLTMPEIALGQAQGFEAALRDYVSSCLGTEGCPLSGTVQDGVAQVQRLLELTRSTPLPTADGRELTYPLAMSGILLPLYEDALWPVLSEALRQAMVERDGSQLLYLADVGADRRSDGTYATNSTEAFWAISCADHPVEGTLADWRRSAEEIAEAAPVFGPALGYSEILCDVWPYESAAERAPLDAEGADPILVVGTTGDPATPYEWSVALADQLASGHLLTYDGAGHTAYGRSNGCVTGAVDAYLLDGEVPAQGTRC